MSIIVDNLRYVYGVKTPTPFEALHGINMEVGDHVFAAIVGETGSGKTTLVQHFNGLNTPTSGTVFVDEYVVTNNKRKNKQLRDLRRRVGLVFQFPEYQLFESTVEKDVMVGPKNFKMEEEEAKKVAHEALREVGIGKEFYERSPFDLSGGEKRRVAIAGILALHPQILVLDEPVAGLDPNGVNEIMSLLVRLYEQGTSIILVTHNMDLVLEYCHEVYALHDGNLIYTGNPEQFFSHLTDDMAIEIPTIYSMINKLNARGYNLSVDNVTNVSSLVEQIVESRGKKHG